ncbi:hypothetical protein SAMN05216259_12433 [Actinacidiphila guanduensis]|uniref:Tyr recombinase domain-containing protein n=1 Tax=Actinacidiphila guanduensis TaxID=310781 RepID=A0A1H0RXF1_9ACTN|nr:hypothetical protein SAMN05216259_12433 [Actinacidiphila guanduensis]
MWADQYVGAWRATGQRPSAVITPDQIGAFLDVAVDSRLYVFYHLLLFRGLRRGEGVCADWVNVDLDAGEFTVQREIIVDGWMPIEEGPKAEESAATIALDSLTVAVLREHKERQPAEREKAGTAWTETGKVFTDELGGCRTAVQGGRPGVGGEGGRSGAQRPQGARREAAGTDAHASLTQPTREGRAGWGGGEVPASHLVCASTPRRHGGAGGTRTHDRRIMSPLL